MAQILGLYNADGTYADVANKSVQAVENSYQNQAMQITGGADLAEERYQQQLAQQRLMEAYQGAHGVGVADPRHMAYNAALGGAQEAGQATLGAAASQRGTVGAQTAALGALGAGQAQQFATGEAVQVGAREDAQNALARAQLAEMIRQQQMGVGAQQREDYATRLGAQRATIAQGQQIESERAAAEARRAQKMQDAAFNAGGAIIAEAGKAYGANK